jgi:hypothetical protein
MKIETTKSETVQCFWYLGSVVNQNNETEEVEERINAGNKALYVNKKLFQCELLSKRSKLRLYWSTIRQVVTYACEAWVLKDNIVHKLIRFERKILRKIYGATKLTDGTCRIKTNEELDNLMEHKNISHFIQAQRLRWLGPVERMPEERDIKYVSHYYYL